MPDKEFDEAAEAGLPLEAPGEPTLDILRHSAAHLMAAAVCELFPGAQYDVGPAIEDGFFYNFRLPAGAHFSDEDLAKIEARMVELSKKKIPYRREVMSRQEARSLFDSMNQSFKVDIIDRMDSGVDQVGIYRTGEFVDLCRGPHVPDSGWLKAVKLLRVAGVYWRGDEKNEQLQRVYGTAWFNREELDAYLERLEEAKKRDHRKLGRELELFFTDDLVGKGLIMWLPRGATIRRILQDYITDIERRKGYKHVFSPHIANTELFKISGHLDKYRETMYPIFGLDEEEYVLKPMNCPHHILMYKHGAHSYRDLPLRLAEMGSVYRYEKSGELGGMVRVRGMTMNDAHIFCRHDQIQDELIATTQLILDSYRDLGIKDFYFRLSAHDPADPKFQGDEEMWTRGEQAIRDAMQSVGWEYQEVSGEAAFYGPKVDVQIRDSLGREFTASTTQLDFLFPERFDLEYIAEDGSRQRPAIIHRAPLGTMERIVSFLIEEYAGHFPLWLAPDQVEIVPVQDDVPAVTNYVTELGQRLETAGLRVNLNDKPGERMQGRIRDAELRKIPYVIVVGKRDVERGDDVVNVRATRRGEQENLRVDDLIAKLREEVDSKRTA